MAVGRGLVYAGVNPHLSCLRFGQKGQKAVAVTYQLSGMHCGACVAKVTQALQPLACEVEVRLSAQQVSLEGANSSIDDLQAALSAVGKYQISALSTETNQAPAVQPSPIQATKGQVVPSWWQTYYPLLLIVAFILGASLLVQLGLHAGHGMGASALSLSETMRYFMAGFIPLSS
jgi:copper chaperone CopZ